MREGAQFGVFLRTIPYRLCRAMVVMNDDVDVESRRAVHVAHEPPRLYVPQEFCDCSDGRMVVIMMMPAKSV